MINYYPLDFSTQASRVSCAEGMHKIHVLEQYLDGRVVMEIWKDFWSKMKLDFRLWLETTSLEDVYLMARMELEE